MWVVCLLRERWAIRQRGKCHEHVVLMIAACGKKIEKGDIYLEKNGLLELLSTYTTLWQVRSRSPK